MFLEPLKDNSPGGHSAQTIFFPNNYIASKEIVTPDERNYCIMAIFMLRRGRISPVQQQKCSWIILLGDGPKQTILGIWHVSLWQEGVSGRDSTCAVSGLVISLSSVPWWDTSDTWKENFKARKLFKEIELWNTMEYWVHHYGFSSVYLLPLYPTEKLSRHCCHLQVISGFRQYLPNEGPAES